MTNNEARAHFKDLGLTYNDITLDDMNLLRDMLDARFIQQRIDRMKTGSKPLYWDRVNRDEFHKGAWFEAADGTLRLERAFLTACGEYFDDREVISFNRDGFIGFCGAADRENAKPVLESFIEWCDLLAERKERKPC